MNERRYSGTARGAGDASAARRALVEVDDLREPNADPAESIWTHVWYWRARLPERHGQPCRVLARGAKNTVLVQFSDGFLVLTSRYAVRRAER